MSNLSSVLLALLIPTHLQSTSSEALFEQKKSREHWIVQPQGSSAKVHAQMRSIRGEQHASVAELARGHSVLNEFGAPAAVKAGAGGDAASAKASTQPSSSTSIKYLETIRVVYAGDHRPEEDMTLIKAADPKTNEAGIYVEKVKLDGEADMVGVREGMELIEIVKSGQVDRKMFKEGTVEELWEGVSLPLELVFGRLPPGPANLYLAGFIIFCMGATITWCVISNLMHFWEDRAIGAEEASEHGERQIGAYNASKLTHAGTLLRLFARGSLFVSKRVWNQVAGYVLMWLLLTLFFCWVMKEASRLDNTALVSLSGYLNAFMPFFFAMYLSAVFDRWWGIRTNGIGKMWDVVDDLGLVISTSLLGDKEKFKTHRRCQLRYGMLAQALIFQSARRDEDLGRLVKAGLLAESEKEVLESAPGDKAQNCWVWILDLWTDLLKQQAVSETIHQSVLQYCVEGRRAVSTAMTYITCQVPYGWVHLITVMVNVTVIILVMKCAIVSAKTFSEMAHSPTPCFIRKEGVQCSSSFKWEIELICQFLELVLIPLIFIGFLEFTNEMCNPFGCEPSDFPRLQYMTGMRSENEGFFMITGKGSLEGFTNKEKKEEGKAKGKGKEKKEKKESDEIPIG